MKFEVNPLREEHGRTFQHKPSWFRDTTLWTYFEPDPTSPVQTLADYDPEDPARRPWLMRFGDGVYRDPEHPELELSYEKACETADVIAEFVYSYHPDSEDRAEELLKESRKDPAALIVLFDMMEQQGAPVAKVIDMLRAGAKIVSFASWCSAWYFHHAQSIEGDYELFDAFEASWLESQSIPRDWTRMGVLILNSMCRQYTQEEDRYFMYPVEGKAGQGWPPVSTRPGAPPCPAPSEEEWKLAIELTERWGFGDDNPSPTLLDYYC